MEAKFVQKRADSTLTELSFSFCHTLSVFWWMCIFCAHDHTPTLPPLRPYILENKMLFTLLEQTLSLFWDILLLNDLFFEQRRQWMFVYTTEIDWSSLTAWTTSIVALFWKKTDEANFKSLPLFVYDTTTYLGAIPLWSKIYSWVKTSKSML